MNGRIRILSRGLLLPASKRDNEFIAVGFRGKRCGGDLGPLKTADQALQIRRHYVSFSGILAGWF